MSIDYSTDIYILASTSQNLNFSDVILSSLLESLIQMSSSLEDHNANSLDAIAEEKTKPKENQNNEIVVRK